MRFAGRELHCLDELWISAAAAQIARQIVSDLVIGRLGVLVEQLLRHHYETGRAEAALESACFNERFLHWVELAVLREMLHGGHLRAVGEGRQIETARHGVTVHQDRAAAAQDRKSTRLNSSHT